MRQRKNLVRRALGAVLCAAMLMGMLSGCGPKRATKEVKKTTFGIDVAKYQGTIDWARLAEENVDFAMIRVGYRTLLDGIIEADSNGLYNLQEGSKAGIPLGVYFFSTAISEEEAREEARWVAAQIAQYPITYPVVYDCEGFLDPESRQYGMSKEDRTKAALAFLKTIEILGYEGMFYGSKNELEAQWDRKQIEKKYKVWVAQYPAEPYPATEASSYEGKHHMWQYTKAGRVAGIETDVDLDIAYFGYEGIEPPKDPTPPEEVGPDPEAMMAFRPANEKVTAKVETNLRSFPSQDALSKVMMVLKNGEVAQRIAISDSGWSKLEFQGDVYYAVSSYLTADMDYKPLDPQDRDGDGIVTEFEKTERQVTAKKKVNLRTLPSVEREDSEVIATLENGDVATCVGVSSNGWSKLEYNGVTCYAVTSYLMPAGEDAAATEPKKEGIQTQFEEMNDQVTAKVEVNLRSLPSVEDPECVVVASLKNGEVVTRTGINRDVGWSRVEYNGQTLYCVSSYLTGAE